MAGPRGCGWSPGGLAVHADEPGDPAAGALKGLIRVLAYEHPDLRATLVDLDSGENAAAALTVELGSPAIPDDVIAWRSGRRYVERLSRATLGRQNATRWSARRARTSSPGVLADSVGSAHDGSSTEAPAVSCSMGATILRTSSEKSWPNWKAGPVVVVAAGR